ARFAICAWGDEAILRSSWEGRAQWQKEPLQRLYFQTTDAGKEFFERLNKLGPQQTEAREIFYLCLAMGFKGQYHQEGDAMLLEQLKTSNLKFLSGSSIGLPPLDRTELFPEAYPVEAGDSFAAPRKRFFNLTTLAVFVSPLILFGALFLIYSFILSNIGKTFLGTVH
ncbi:MAG TPA: DotU family type IV/VI secretion system protein, partial [Desulfobacterales bacterium]|nr:DotU family type IV/VI secretion system protein [Desulfobacterales bacterium]